MWGVLSDERSGVVDGHFQRSLCRVWVPRDSRALSSFHGYIYIYIYIYRERERGKSNLGGGSERHYIGVEIEKTISSVQKVPRQCPLVLLVGVKQIIRINSKFIFYGVRGAAFERNLIRR
jgi:hypothetical protein